MTSALRRFLALPLCLIALLVATSCATKAPEPPPPPQLSCLRVGFSPDYPPLCTKDDEGRPVGLEADFAAALAEELDCPVDIVPLEFKQLIPSLLEGKVDILMSGMTVTPTRAWQVRFCKPYLSNPLVAATRAGWGDSYHSASHVLSAVTSIGVLRHTYAETFARQHCPRARLVPVFDYDEVPGDLEANRYSVYIDDLAALLFLARQHVGVLDIIPYPLQQQDIAWAVHPDNASLLSAANATLEKWKANGKLDRMLDVYFPDRSWRTRAEGGDGKLGKLP